MEHADTTISAIAIAVCSSFATVSSPTTSSESQRQPREAVGTSHSVGKTDE
ncbi:MAG: hypothetical protein U0787_01180 [Polyangia bacterium]